MPGSQVSRPLSRQLGELRERADQDYLSAPVNREAGRHQIEVLELGLRVAITRSRYPNRPDGVDLYAVTLSRTALDHAPADPEVQAVLEAGFGDRAAEAVERPGGGRLVRMFRVPA